MHDGEQRPIEGKIRGRGDDAVGGSCSRLHILKPVQTFLNILTAWIFFLTFLVGSKIAF